MYGRIFSLVVLFALMSKADVVSLYNWGFYDNGTIITDVKDLKGNVTWTEGFWENGLGTFSVSIDGNLSSVNSMAMFFDHQIMVEENTYFNEYGSINGTAPDPRLSYEIDEPGYGNGYYIGDIYDNFTFFREYKFDGALFHDGFMGDDLSEYQQPVSDDAAMAMGWNFILTNEQTALLEFIASDKEPLDGFYLAQKDRDSPQNSIYLQSSLKIMATDVPEPDTLHLICCGIILLLTMNCGCFRKQKNARF